MFLYLKYKFTPIGNNYVLILFNLIIENNLMQLFKVLELKMTHLLELLTIANIFFCSYFFHNGYLLEIVYYFQFIFVFHTKIV